MRPAALLLAAFLVLTACSTTPRRSGAPASPGDQLATLHALEGFDFDGRVAGAVGKEGFNAQLELEQRGARSRLSLRSPLGFGSATVETDGSEMTFRSSRGESATGEAARAALTARLGFEPPLGSLRYWLLGVPDPKLPAIQQVPVADGPRGFEQQGWQVTVTESVPAAAPSGEVLVPRRLTLERAPVRLRIVVDKWKLGT
jgi:outer membrane lipoprotein LolB